MRIALQELHDWLIDRREVREDTGGGRVVRRRRRPLLLLALHLFRSSSAGGRFYGAGRSLCGWPAWRWA